MENFATSLKNRFFFLFLNSWPQILTENFLENRRRTLYEVTLRTFMHARMSFEMIIELIKFFVILFKASQELKSRSFSGSQ